jgi:hypothetical protein
LLKSNSPDLYCFLSNDKRRLKPVFLVFTSHNTQKLSQFTSAKVVEKPVEAKLTFYQARAACDPLCTLLNVMKTRENILYTYNANYSSGDFLRTN